MCGKLDAAGVLGELQAEGGRGRDSSHKLLDCHRSQHLDSAIEPQTH